MTRQDKLAAIREACIRANPEKSWTRSSAIFGVVAESVSLADVLLAIGDKLATELDSIVATPIGNGSLKIDCDHTRAYWNLRLDSLDDQDDPTVDFIHQLLENR